MKLIFVALIILLLTGLVFAQTTVNKTGEIRGQVAGTVNGFTWNPQNFAGFYYDIKDGLGTETLEFTLTENNMLSGDSPYGIRYVTTAQPKAFKFEDWGAFNVMGFLAERYFAGYVSNENAEKNILSKESTDENSLSSEQLQKILVDDDNETTFTSGTPLKFEEGYELAIKGIDIDGNKVYLELSKDGSVVDSKVISPSKTNATMADKTYYYRNPAVGDQRKLITIAAHFKNISRGADQNLATVDGLWQISCEATVVKADDQYDKMTITSVDANNGVITMENKDIAISLSKNTDTVLMNDISIKTADNDTLSFYIYSNPSIAAVWRQKGNILYNQGKYGEAKKAYDEAIRLNPKDDTAWNNKGNVLILLSEYDEAVKAYDEVIRLDPKFSMALINKGNALDGLTRYDEAIQSYKKASGIDQTYSFGMVDKGNSHYNAGEYVAAIRYYDEAIKKDPKDEYAWYNKAMALRMLHRDSEAKAAYAKARELGYSGTMTLMEMTTK